MSALRLIHSSSISGVSFADIDNVFNSDFDIYKIVGTNWKLTTSQGNNLVYVKFLQKGVVYEDYSRAYAYSREAGSTYIQIKSTSNEGISIYSDTDADSNASSNFEMWLFNFHTSGAAGYATLSAAGAAQDASSGDITFMHKGNFAPNTNANFTGVRMEARSGGGNISGKLNIYGLRAE